MSKPCLHCELLKTLVAYQAKHGEPVEGTTAKGLHYEMATTHVATLIAEVAAPAYVSVANTRKGERVIDYVMNAVSDALYQEIIRLQNAATAPANAVKH